MLETEEQKFRNKREEGSTDFLLPFEKMHGCGNDFVMVDYRHLPWEAGAVGKDFTDREQDLAAKICDRNYGVGADGLIIIYPVKDSEEALWAWRYYNSDGSVGEMCGNGMRCAAKFIYEHGLSQEETQFKIETLAGDISVSLLEDEMVKVGMGQAREHNKGLSLEVNDPNSKSKFKFDYDFVSMGNPHAIGFFNGNSSVELERFSHNGPAIEAHSDFLNKTNVEFARVESETSIELIVWERGCGFTKACGTGACATVVAAIDHGFCQKDSDITVKLPGGDLVVRVDTVAEDIFMTGQALMVFNGNYHYKV